MGWYRTRGGRLIHGEQGLAAVYEARGWQPVDDETALAEVASGEAQVRADVEGELAAVVDAQEHEHPGTGVASEGIEVPADGSVHTVDVEGEPDPDDPDGQIMTVDPAGEDALLVTRKGSRRLSRAEQDDVDEALRHEGYGG